MPIGTAQRIYYNAKKKPTCLPTGRHHKRQGDSYLKTLFCLSYVKEFKKRYLDKLKQAFEKKELNLPPDTTKKSFAMLIKKVWAK